MRDRQEKEIGGDKISVTQLPAMQAFKLLNRLGRVLSPALVKAVGGTGGGKVLDLGGMDIAMIGDALRSLFETLDDGELDKIVGGLLSTAQVFVADDRGGKWVALADANNLSTSHFNVLYRGRLLDLVGALVFAIEVNYSDFFAYLRSRQGKAQEQTKTASALPVSTT